MQKFTVHTGLAVPLDSANIDTDQIIPKQFLLAVDRLGFGAHLFHDWRYLDDAETKMPVRISGGVTGVRHGDTIEAAIDRADVGLYESKNAGKGTVTVHDA